jgi:cation-transporting ATPase 13A3/4/5
MLCEQPEIRANSEEASMRSDLINLNIENAPFENSNEEFENCIIAVTGQSFEALWKLRNKYLQTEKSELRIYYETFRKILQNGYIFARMSPEHKTILVECLRDEKFTVLMCGDGANDCGALRAADVGVSLSIKEASIAAHFTSNRPDISCLIKLLREGKASLATSIQTFKYMIMYSLIQFISVSILVVLNSYLTDAQFLVSDFFITFPLAFLIGRTGAYEKLTAQKPNSALVSLPIITSIAVQTLIQLLAQYGVYVLLGYQKGYKNECVTNKDDSYPCLANSVCAYNFLFI